NQPTWKQRFSALLHYFFAPKRYSSKNSFSIQLAINFAIATAVVVVLHIAEDLVFFKEIKDFALDTIMYYHSDFEPTLENGEKMQRMALITIDDKTYRDWGFPVITPRDKLQALIEKAVDGGANVIAVDIELSWASEGYIHAPDSLSLSTADQTLVDYLHNINARDTAPPILLAGMYRKPLKDNGIIDNNAFLERQPSFLDGVLKEEKNVFWASSFFVVDEDRIWRQWQLAPLVCQEGHLTVVPSLALLTALAELHSVEGNAAAQKIRDLKTRLNDWAKQFSCEVKEKTIAELCRIPKTCPDFTVTLPQKEGVNDDSHLINLAASDAKERIVYRFAPSDKPDLKRGAVIDIYSAAEVLADEAELENQIVFIGVTHQDSGDRHPIPIRALTDVDGVYIVANAADTLLRFGQLQPQTPQSKIIESIILVILMTAIFTLFSVVPAFILSSLFVFALIIWTFYELRHGVDVDVALRSLTIQIFQTVGQVRYLAWKNSQEIKKVWKNAQ
ncbi:CHASE2 domain-containing protein, partial [Candidatus Marithioploca araucensis]|nr:CHASE2 domain-containing protein [Candidatus Marithioploca araucensis]